MTLPLITSMSRLTLCAAIATLFIGPAIVLADSPDSDLVPPLASSRTGATGIINVPSADVAPDGDIMGAAFSLHQATGTLGLGDLVGESVTIGFLPRTELGFVLNDPNHYEDLVFNAKYQVMVQHSLWPFIAVGIVDAKANDRDKTEYVAATRHILNGRLRLTVGALSGGTSGLYGGAEAAILPHLSAVAESDTRTVNYGVRLGFIKNQIILSGMHVRYGWSASVGFRLPLGYGQKQVPSKVVLPQTADAPGDAARDIQDHLVKMGLENVTVQVTPATIQPNSGSGGTMEAVASPAPEATGSVDVVYENRTFAHTEMAALANVLATEAVFAPKDIGTLSAVAVRDNTPILRVSCPVNTYRDFMTGHISQTEFAKTFKAEFTASRPKRWPGSVRTPVRASSYGHADLFIRPAFNTQIATENWIAGAAFMVRPELYLPIARGTVIDSIGTIPVGGPFGSVSRLPHFTGPLQVPSASLDRVALDYSLRPSDLTLSRTFAGYFAGRRRGVYSELYFLPPNSLWNCRAALGLIDSMDGPQDPTVTVDARYYEPHLNLVTHLTAGHYLYGDDGYGVDLIRRFGETDLGLQFRDTSIGRAAGIYVQLPLGPDHLSQNPSTLRIRPPDFLEQGQESLLTRPNYISVLSRVANELVTGTPAYTSLLGDDRLTPAYVNRSLLQLREIRLFQILPAHTPIKNADAVGK